MSWLGVVWSRYVRALEAQPVCTQMGSSAVLWCVGDLVAQGAERRLHLHPKHAHRKEPDSSSERVSSVDWRRVGVQTAYAAFVWAPAAHYWYELLDRTAHRLARAGTRRFVAVKLGLEMIALHPVSLAAFFFCVGLANKEPLKEVGEQIRRDLPPSLLLEYAMWTPLDLLNFACVPVRHQLLVNNLGSLVESGVLSAIRANGFGFENAEPNLQTEPRLGEGLERAGQHRNGAFHSIFGRRNGGGGNGVVVQTHTRDDTEYQPAVTVASALAPERRSASEACKPDRGQGNFEPADTGHRSKGSA